MKTVKRIVVFLLLLALCFTVGYLFYTGSRFTEEFVKTEEAMGELGGVSD